MKDYQEALYQILDDNTLNDGTNKILLQELIDLYKSKIGKFVTVENGERPFMIVNERRTTIYEISLPKDKTTMWISSDEVLKFSEFKKG